MATPVLWHNDLPDWLMQNGYSEKEGETVLSTEMGYGIDKKRARYTKAIDQIQCQMLLSATQKPIFKSFFRTSLGGGALPFLFKEPYTGVLKKYRFRESPTYSDIGGGWTVVSMSWEQLP